jgi:hypothetical protein
MQLDLIIDAACIRDLQVCIGVRWCLHRTPRHGRFGIRMITVFRSSDI